MEPTPIRYNTTAAIKVVILPSKIADNALLKPASIALLTDAPAPSSSLIRVKIITFASTAIPTDNTIPARPGSVRLALNPFRHNNINTTYAINARTEMKPGNKYKPIIMTAITPIPIAPAFKVVLRASLPSVAPTSFERNSSNVNGRAPIRMVCASCSASSSSAIPLITALPPVIAV